MMGCLSFVVHFKSLRLLHLKNFTATLFCSSSARNLKRFVVMPKRRYVFNAVINHCRSILQASPFTAFVNIYNYKKVCSTPWNSSVFLIILNFLRDPSSKMALFKSFGYGWWFRFRFVCWLCLLILFQFVLFYIIKILILNLLFVGENLFQKLTSLGDYLITNMFVHFDSFCSYIDYQKN